TIPPKALFIDGFGFPVRFQSSESPRLFRAPNLTEISSTSLTFFHPFAYSKFAFNIPPTPLVSPLRLQKPHSPPSIQNTTIFLTVKFEMQHNFFSNLILSF